MSTPTAPGTGSPAAWQGHDALYFLGVGGPTDETGIGHVERFQWRCLVRVGGGRPDAVLAFSAMPRLIAFTRAVNGRTPQAVSTEALRVPTARIGPEIAVEVTVDLAPDAFAAWLGDATLVERPVPALER